MRLNQGHTIGMAKRKQKESGFDALLEGSREWWHQLPIVEQMAGRERELVQLTARLAS
jgi:hypothetical protein